FKYRISEPDRFDIVVFHASVQKDFIKRIIGLPGEHVQVKDNVLYINGEEVPEPFLREQKEQIKPYQTLTNDFKLEDLRGGYEIIPENHVLVVGDNGGNATESGMFGVLVIDQIIEKTGLIYGLFVRKQILHADDPTKKEL